MSNRKVKTYTIEFKQSSAKLAVTTDQSLSQTAREIGVSSSTLHTWVQKYYPKELTPQRPENSLEDEIKRLKKENSKLKQEREILKKAAAYFANELS